MHWTNKKSIKACAHSLRAFFCLVLYLSSSMKFIFVTWWVISWLWKGIAAASIGKLLKTAWYTVTIIKLDPYLQIDAWTMSPYEHGECFVTDDGFETDLDLWHYERFLNQSINKESSITTGQIYQHIINKERTWDYLWQTVQVIPHVTDEVKFRIKKQAKKYDITIIEVWWTIGDIEWPHFIEAIRQMKKDIWAEHTMYLHLAPLLYLKYSGEMKTKPIQHSVRELTRLGIHPDMLLCRTEYPMTKKIKEKLSLFCDLDDTYIIEVMDAQSIYQVPEMLKKQGVDKLIQERLWITIKPANLTSWNQRARDFLHPKTCITIGMVGKYAEMQDSYLSVLEALKHAWAYHKTKININWILAEEFNQSEKIQALIDQNIIHGLLIPGWFGTRWMEGKIKATQLCRTQHIPFLGLCLWLQMAVVEFARHVCGLEWAHTVEAEPNCSTPIISRMPGQTDAWEKWWTMRLGQYTTKLKKWSRVAALYNTLKVNERHRHRFEVNPDYYELLEEHGMVLSGRDTVSQLVEFIELPHHPFFVWTQAHPEFKSRLDTPHPLFVWFVEACIKNTQSK